MPCSVAWEADGDSDLPWVSTGAPRARLPPDYSWCGQSCPQPKSCLSAPRSAALVPGLPTGHLSRSLCSCRPWAPQSCTGLPWYLHSGCLCLAVVKCAQSPLRAAWLPAPPVSEPGKHLGSLRQPSSPWGTECQRVSSVSVGCCWKTLRALVLCTSLCRGPHPSKHCAQSLL